MPQFSFGSGYLYGIPSTSSTDQTPILFGTLQNVTLSISYAVKKLVGQYQSPVAVARGAATYQIKAKAASLSSQAFNTIFAGQNPSTGALLVVNNEPHAAATSIVVTQATGFQDDLGVVYASGANAGVPLKKVASAPTTGQYSVATSTGTYTFASGDVGVNMYINYTYQQNTTGSTLTAVNTLMGSAPVFSIVLSVPFNQFGTVVTYKFFNCMSDKLTMDFKNEDFTVPEFDCEAYANAAGQIYQASFSDAY